VDPNVVPSQPHHFGGSGEGILEDNITQQGFRGEAVEDGCILAGAHNHTDPHICVLVGLDGLLESNDCAIHKDKVGENERKKERTKERRPKNERRARRRGKKEIKEEK